jgi:PLP dependent protein
MNSLPAPQPQDIRERYERILEQITGAALRVGRSPDSVRVVVVTKTQPIETLRAALQAGITEIGENYAEEAVEKMSALGESPRVNWHMIGHVQSRKAGLVAKHFSLLHSLDNLKLAARLDRAALEEKRILPVLIECNVSGEASKFGFSGWDRSHWADLLEQVQQIVQLPGLSLRGLMTMPPFVEDAEQSRPYFQRLRALRDYLQQQIPHATLDEFSMGTSADFACAVEEGATLVRIGTAIVGPRQRI